jgi:hypothetical protein
LVQQNVVSPWGVALPADCPPLGVHEPTTGVVVNSIPFPVVPAHATGSGLKSDTCVAHIGLLKVVTCPFELQSTEGVSHVHVVHPRPSATPPK